MSAVVARAPNAFGRDEERAPQRLFADRVHERWLAEQHEPAVVEHRDRSRPPHIYLAEELAERIGEKRCNDHSVERPRRRGELAAERDDERAVVRGDSSWDVDDEAVSGARRDLREDEMIPSGLANDHWLRRMAHDAGGVDDRDRRHGSEADLCRLKGR